jgi:hypothetical protein
MAVANETNRALIRRWINRQPLSMKTTCVEVLGTQNKTDVMRVLRTQDMLSYASGGGRHEILPAGQLYFTYDAERRAQDKQLVPDVNLGSAWKEKAGSEIYITPINALRLKKDLFDERLMHLIDPPKLVVRKGLRTRQELNQLPDLDEMLAMVGMDDDVAIEDQPTNPFRQQWIDLLLDALAKGEKPGDDVRAGVWLTSIKTMALLNETAERADVELSNLAEARIHIEKFCSFPMMQMLEVVFTTEASLAVYVQQVMATTAEVFLGYTPELV